MQVLRLLETIEMVHVQGAQTCSGLRDHRLQRRQASGTVQDREAVTVAELNTQCVKTVEVEGPIGFNAAKKIKGRKRHAMVDTDGRTLFIQMYRAYIQDCGRVIRLLQGSLGSFPFVERAFADSAYGSDRVRDSTCTTIEVFRKIAAQVGFQVMPWLWVVEWCLARINRNRRLAKDFEASIASAETFLYAAAVRIPARRLARQASVSIQAFGRRISLGSRLTYFFFRFK